MSCGNQSEEGRRCSLRHDDGGVGAAFAGGEQFHGLPNGFGMNRDSEVGVVASVVDPLHDHAFEARTAFGTHGEDGSTAVSGIYQKSLLK